ncbi:unnamed protein product, partial [Effrenium voratum]
QENRHVKDRRDSRSPPRERERDRERERERERAKAEEVPRHDSSRGARRRFEEALQEEAWAAGEAGIGLERSAVSSFAPEEGGWVSSTQEASSGSWVVTEEATHEYEEQKQKAAEEKQKRMEEEKRRKAKLANAFAFGNEDDEDKREQ